MNVDHIDTFFREAGMLPVPHDTLDRVYTEKEKPHTPIDILSATMERACT